MILKDLLLASLSVIGRPCNIVGQMYTGIRKAKKMNLKTAVDKMIKLVAKRSLNTSK